MDLCFIANADSSAVTVAEQPLEAILFVRGGDDQYLPNPLMHQCAQWVIDHRLVVESQ